MSRLGEESFLLQQGCPTPPKPACSRQIHCHRGWCRARPTSPLKPPQLAWSASNSGTGVCASPRREADALWVAIGCASVVVKCQAVAFGSANLPKKKKRPLDHHPQRTPRCVVSIPPFSSTFRPTLPEALFPRHLLQDGSRGS